MVLPSTSFFPNRWSLSAVFHFAGSIFQPAEEAKTVNICRRNVVLSSKTILSLAPPQKTFPVWEPPRRQRNSHSTFQLAYTILTIRTGRRPVRDNPFSLGPQSFGCFGRSVPVVSGGSQSFLWDLNSFSEHWSIYFWISELSNHNNKKERNERFVQNKQGHKSLMNAFSPVWWSTAKSDVTAAIRLLNVKHARVKFDQKNICRSHLIKKHSQDKFDFKKSIHGSNLIKKRLQVKFDQKTFAG